MSTKALKAPTLAEIQRYRSCNVHEAAWFKLGFNEALAALSQQEAPAAAVVEPVAMRLYNALTWALGTNGTFKPQGTMDGKYWWRNELAERAGLEWDGQKYRPTPAEPDMRAICEALGFDPTNHHNAAKCPYCRPAEPAQADGGEPAPPNSLPDWNECAMRVDNSNFIAKRVAEGGYGPEHDSKTATELHRFIYEYDDADPYRSAWFMHRLEKLIASLAAGAGV